MLPKNTKAPLIVALAALLGAGGAPIVRPRSNECTHSFGLAGRFSSCSACGISVKKRRK